MKNVKRIIAVVLTLIMVLSFAGCGDSPESGGNDGSDGADKKKFTIAHVVSTDTCYGEMCDAIEKTMEDSGLFDVDVYPNASLVGDSEGVQAVQAGTISMYISACGSYAPYAAPFFVYDKMFAIDNEEIGRKVANDKELWAVLNSELEQYNIKVLGMGDMGFRKLTANKKINAISDLNDIKLRVQENPIYVVAWKALGINPTPVSYTEIYSSLQQGVIAAQENPVELCYATKVYEVQKYIIDTNHLFHNLPIAVNLDYYNSLTDEERAVVEDAVAAGVEACQAATDQHSEELYQVFEDAGCQHIQIDSAVRDEMKKRMSESWSEVESRVSPELWKAYDDAIKRAASGM